MYVAITEAVGNRVIKHFESIAEMGEWASFNGLALVIEGPIHSSPEFTAQHSDGSPLSDTERTALAESMNRPQESIFTEQQKADMLPLRLLPRKTE